MCVWICVLDWNFNIASVRNVQYQFCSKTRLFVDSTVVTVIKTVLFLGCCINCEVRTCVMHACPGLAVS